MMIDVSEAKTLAREKFLDYCPDKAPFNIDIKVKEQMENVRQGFLQDVMVAIEKRGAINDGKIHTSALSAIMVVVVDLEVAYERLTGHAVS